MAIPIIPLLVMLVGLLMYLFASREKGEKVRRIGEILFFVGVLVTILALAATRVRVG